MSIWTISNELISTICPLKMIKWTRNLLIILTTIKLTVKQVFSSLESQKVYIPMERREYSSKLRTIKWSLELVAVLRQWKDSLTITARMKSVRGSEHSTTHTWFQKLKMVLKYKQVAKTHYNHWTQIETTNSSYHQTRSQSFVLRPMVSRSKMWLLSQLME